MLATWPIWIVNVNYVVIPGHVFPQLDYPTGNQGDVGSNPTQGTKSFSPNENVFQGLSVLGPFKFH